MSLKKGDADVIVAMAEHLRSELEAMREAREGYQTGSLASLVVALARAHAKCIRLRTPIEGWEKKDLVRELESASPRT